MYTSRVGIKDSYIYVNNYRQYIYIFSKFLAQDNDFPAF